jgi:hypothetical protein
VEATGGGEAMTHVSKKLRLASFGRHRDAMGSHLVALRSFQTEKSIDRVRIGGLIYQARFGSQLLGQPPPQPTERMTQSGAEEPLIAGFGTPSQQTAVKGLMHNERKVRHLGGCPTRLEDGPILRDPLEVEGS